MIADSMARQGSWFFRWRSYVLLGFAPLAFLVVTQPEPIETAFGHCGRYAVRIGLHRACLPRPRHTRRARSATCRRARPGATRRSRSPTTLNTTGLYSLTRNPLYLGNAVIYMAIACFLAERLVLGR